MIDEHPDPGPDPLAGRDPHPRAQIDLWPLHDARQELLEEIVSQPGPGNAAAPSTRRILVPVGIAAAVVLVAGGAWFVVADDSGNGNDDQVVASSDAPPEGTGDATGSTDVATDATTEASSEPTTEPAEPTRIPVSELRKGDVLSPQQCRQIRRGIVDGRGADQPRRTLRESWTYIVLVDGKHGRVRWVRSISADDRRVIGIDKDCEIVAIGRHPKLVRVRD